MEDKKGRPCRLSVEVQEDDLKKVRMLAAQKDMLIGEYVRDLIRSQRVMPMDENGNIQA